MRRTGLLLALAIVTLAPGAGLAASVPSKARALATVSAIVRAHARDCRVAFDRVSAEAVGDPVVPSVTIGWRVEARVRRFGEARLRTVADWRVDARGARPDSPLAGQLAVGCTHVDPGRPTALEQWHSLPYLAADGSLYLTGNGAWAGSAETVPTGRSELSFARYPWGERFRYVWASKCTPARQEISLRRTIYLPGVPAEAKAVLASVALRPGRAAANPVRSLRLLVNGRVAIAVLGAGAPAAELPPSALALFAHGANDVELIAEKRATLACNAGGQSLEVGIAFELTGRFTSSLAIPPGGFRAPGFHREGTAFFGRASRATQGRAGSLRFVIHNAGPSAAPGATFSLDLIGAARITFVARTVSRDVLGCETSDATGDFTRLPPYRLVCTLADLDAGLTLPLDLKYRFRAGGPFTQQALKLVWSLESSQSPAPSRGTAVLVFCGAHASSAGCARAP